MVTHLPEEGPEHAYGVCTDHKKSPHRAHGVLGKAEQISVED